MHQRIVGLEYEYAVTFEPADGTRRPPNLDNAALASGAFDAARRLYLGDRASATILWLNGGKLYLDRQHVEWAAPECLGARQGVLYDKAGERLLDRIAAATERHLAKTRQRGSVLFIKNNVDPRGTPYGCHENYLVQKTTPALPDASEFLTYLQRQLIPFLVSRIVICGSGRATAGGYQISQRAEIIKSAVSDNTTDDRPIVNARDESHTSGGQQYRRLHLIVGDANMSEWATFLKLGTTALVLEMIEDVFLGPAPELHNAVAALQAISRDLELRKGLPLLKGGTTTALEIQRHYLKAAQEYFSPVPDEETGTLLTAWADTLTALENRDFHTLARRLDWVAKKKIIEANWPDLTDWGDPRVVDTDQKYHIVRPEQSVFAQLTELGIIEPLIQPREAIENAVDEAPRFTRARLRAEAFRRGQAVGNWDELKLNPPVPLPDPLEWCTPQVLKRLGLSEAEMSAWFQSGLAAPDPAVRGRALKELAKLNPTKKVGPLVRNALADPDPTVRAAAAEAINTLASQVNLKALRKLVDEKGNPDPHHLVRLRATETLLAPRGEQ